MTAPGQLPRSIDVNGRMRRIRSDFRDILRILAAFSDPNLPDNEKVYVCLCILYRDFEALPECDYESAFRAAIQFIDHGMDRGTSAAPSKPIMDWEQDEGIMFPAINKVAGFEVRSAKYVHWWTFLGYYLEISDGVFANVLSIRLKKSKGKKLEKWEREYWQANKAICDLRPKLSDTERAEKDRLNEMLGD